MKLFDSTVLIAHLRGAEQATELIVASVTSGEAACSVMSRIEIEGSMRSAERDDVRHLFGALRMLPVTDHIAARAGVFLRTYRRSHVGIDVVDYVIAATAQLINADLATLNVKHFPMFDRLRPAFQ